MPALDRNLPVRKKWLLNITLPGTQNLAIAMITHIRVGVVAFLFLKLNSVAKYCREHCFDNVKPIIVEYFN